MPVWSPELENAGAVDGLDAQNAEGKPSEIRLLNGLGPDPAQGEKAEDRRTGFFIRTGQTVPDLKTAAGK